MRIAEGFKDYELIDASSGQRLERWGDAVLIRPDPQAVWKTDKKNPMWKKADAVYHRSSKGGGYWETKRKLPSEWTFQWEDKLKMYVTPTGFKHTGVFPEQAANWKLYQQIIRGANRPIKVLNLFGYTGGATVACLLSGASVCHVDASKGMVAAAKRNVGLSGLSESSVRYIVDDCEKFVSREIRRGNRYDAIIMDPPSYGRGPSGEIWKIEDAIYDLVVACKGVLSDNPLFFAINSYTTGLAPAVMDYILSSCLIGDFGGKVQSDEIGISVTESGFALPCGSTAIYLGE